MINWFHQDQSTIQQHSSNTDPAVLLQLTRVFNEEATRLRRESLPTSDQLSVFIDQFCHPVLNKIIICSNKSPAVYTQQLVHLVCSTVCDTITDLTVQIAKQKDLHEDVSVKAISKWSTLLQKFISIEDTLRKIDGVCDLLAEFQLSKLTLVYHCFIGVIIGNKPPGASPPSEQQIRYSRKTCLWLATVWAKACSLYFVTTSQSTPISLQNLIRINELLQQMLYACYVLLPYYCPDMRKLLFTVSPNAKDFAIGQISAAILPVVERLQIVAYTLLSQSQMAKWCWTPLCQCMEGGYLHRMRLPHYFSDGELPCPSPDSVIEQCLVIVQQHLTLCCLLTCARLKSQHLNLVDVLQIVSLETATRLATRTELSEMSAWLLEEFYYALRFLELRFSTDSLPVFLLVSPLVISSNGSLQLVTKIERYLWRHFSNALQGIGNPVIEEQGFQVREMNNSDLLRVFKNLVMWTQLFSFFDGYWDIVGQVAVWVAKLSQAMGMDLQDEKTAATIRFDNSMRLLSRAVQCWFMLDMADGVTSHSFGGPQLPFIENMCGRIGKWSVLTGTGTNVQSPQFGSKSTWVDTMNDDTDPHHVDGSTPFNEILEVVSTLLGQVLGIYWNSNKVPNDRVVRLVEWICSLSDTCSECHTGTEHTFGCTICHLIQIVSPLILKGISVSRLVAAVDQLVSLFRRTAKMVLIQSQYNPVDILEQIICSPVGAQWKCETTMAFDQSSHLRLLKQKYLTGLRLRQTADGILESIRILLVILGLEEVGTGMYNVWTCNSRINSKHGSIESCCYAALPLVSSSTWTSVYLLDNNNNSYVIKYSDDLNRLIDQFEICSDFEQKKSYLRLLIQNCFKLFSVSCWLGDLTKLEDISNKKVAFTDLYINRIESFLFVYREWVESSWTLPGILIRDEFSRINKHIGKIELSDLMLLDNCILVLCLSCLIANSINNCNYIQLFNQMPLIQISQLINQIIVLSYYSIYNLIIFKYPLPSIILENTEINPHNQSSYHIQYHILSQVFTSSVVADSISRKNQSRDQQELASGCQTVNPPMIILQWPQELFQRNGSSPHLCLSIIRIVFPVHPIVITAHFDNPQLTLIFSKLYSFIQDTVLDQPQLQTVAPQQHETTFSDTPVPTKRCDNLTSRVNTEEPAVMLTPRKMSEARVDVQIAKMATSRAVTPQQRAWWSYKFTNETDLTAMLESIFQIITTRPAVGKTQLPMFYCELLWVMLPLYHSCCVSSVMNKAFNVIHSFIRKFRKPAQGTLKYSLYSIAAWLLVYYVAAIVSSTTRALMLNSKVDSQNSSLLLLIKQSIIQTSETTFIQILQHFTHEAHRKKSAKPSNASRSVFAAIIDIFMSHSIGFRIPFRHQQENVHRNHNMCSTPSRKDTLSDTLANQLLLDDTLQVGTMVLSIIIPNHASIANFPWSSILNADSVENVIPIVVAPNLMHCLQSTTHMSTIASLSALEVFYTINPDGTLPETEQIVTLLPHLFGSPNWTGTVGTLQKHSLPKIDVLNQKDVYVYCGHSGAECVFPLDVFELGKSSIRAGCMLLGCNSASVVKGNFSALQKFLMTGSCWGIGLLWSTPARDLDRWAFRFFELWNSVKLENSETTNKRCTFAQSLDCAEANGKSRGEEPGLPCICQRATIVPMLALHAKINCKLPLTTGGAVVCIV